MFFADLHCHPSMRPVNHNTGSMWEPNPGQKVKKLVKEQLEGKRGALYDQSGMPKLQTGRVRLVFASLYPLEKCFLRNKNLLLHGLNLAKFIITLPLSFLNGFFSPDFNFRDIFLGIFTKFKSKRLAELKTEGYWEGFLKEAEYYVNEHNDAVKIGSDAAQEISRLLPYTGLQGDAFKEQGHYVVADKHNPPAQIPEDKVIAILTMEGMGMLSQERIADTGLTNVGLRNLEKQEIINRIRYVKEKLPVFFITFCHHFDNGLCGHARSMPVIAQKLKLLDQGSRISEGFNQLGFDILKYLLAVREVNDQVVDDPAAGRRILIDLKHMSIQGRLAVYALVEKYNLAHPAAKIPLIASHVGFSGLSVAKLVDNIHQGKEDDKHQIDKREANNNRELRFNNWSINLGKEEISRIIESDGLIGLSMEQNILGVGFFEKLKNKDASFHARLLVHQLLVMAQAAGSAKFWEHICIGTDFDGVINPVDRYSSTLFYTRLRNDIEAELLALSTVERMGYFLPPKEPDDTIDRRNIADLLDDFCFNNAFRFATAYFDHQSMPAIREVFA